MNRRLPLLALATLVLASPAVGAPAGPVQIRCDDQQLPRLPEFSRVTGLANSDQAHVARHRLMVDVDRLCQRGYAAVLWDHDVDLAALRPVPSLDRLAMVDARH